MGGLIGVARRENAATLGVVRFVFEYELVRGWRLKLSEERLRIGCLGSAAKEWLGRGHRV